MMIFVNILLGSVSIHTPTKGVTRIDAQTLREIKVSIHTPTKGVTKEGLLSLRIICSFNPHTHEGCDKYCHIILVCLLVSIHTPTKGVTFMLGKMPIGKAVSIHTPTKGVTCMTTAPVSWEHVSIHTPTKGVTFRCLCFCHSFCCFNPHTHEGCDRLCKSRISLMLPFQSTHPRRV